MMNTPSSRFKSSQLRRNSKLAVNSRHGAVRIAVLTCLTQKDFFKEVKEAYCRLYGYEMIFSEEDFFHGRHPAWRKIGMIGRYLAKFDWVVYVSPNVGFANFTIPLEKIINEQSKGRDIIVCRDSSCTVNTDVVFFRSCLKSFQFLEAWGNERTYVKWNGGDRHDSYSFYKLATGAYSGCVSLVVPCRVFNALASGVFMDSRKLYHVGDFVENCSQLSLADIVSESRRISRSNEDYWRGIKTVGFVELKEEERGEDMRFTESVLHPVKVMGPPGVGVASVLRKVESQKPVEINKTPSNLEDDTRKIVIDTGNEKITIWKNSKENVRDVVAKETSGGSWGFSYPDI